MDEKTYKSLRQVVVYMTIKEDTHYEELGKPKHHIFRHVLQLAKWLDKNRPQK